MTAPHAYYANLVGVNFRPKPVKDIIAALAPGAPVRLERDPLNSHDENAIQVHWTEQVPYTSAKHVLYKTGDTDAPEVIKDRNGEVVLGLCKICGRGEIELSDPCVGSWDGLTYVDGESHFLGYIERGVAAQLAPYMDGGTPFEAHIHSATADRNAPWLLEIFPTGPLNKVVVSERELDKHHIHPAFASGHYPLDDDIPF